MAILTEVVLTAFLIVLALCWVIVISRWVMFADRPKSRVFHAFSAVVMITGLGTAAVIAQV